MPLEFLVSCILLPLIPITFILSWVLVYRQSHQFKVLQERFDLLRQLLESQNARLNRLNALVESKPESIPQDGVVSEATPVPPVADADAVEVQPDVERVADESVQTDIAPVRRSAAFVSARTASAPSTPSSDIPEELVGPVVKREPNRFETAAREVLSKVWNWVTVGEEHRSQDVSLEYAVASTWLLRVGVLILVIGIGFFLRYSIQQGWIGPEGRVALSLVFGAGMLVAGIRVLRTRYDLLGQGLMGAGVSTLYFGIFAAYNFHGLISAMPAFVLMAGITTTAAIVAVRFNTVLVAVLGIIVGYGTPILLETTDTNFVGVFSYLLLLGVGVLGISARRNWHVLNFLSFVCSYVVFFQQLNVGNFDPTSTEQFLQVMPFLSAYFVLFSTMVFLFNVVHRKKSTVLGLLALVVNAGIFFVSSYVMIERAYGESWVALVTVVLAVFYTAHVQYFLSRGLQDRGLLLSFIALAAFFVGVTIPIQFSKEWLTVSWSIQAAIMLWIAMRMDSRFLRHLSYVLYVIVVYRFGLLDLPRQYGTPIGDALTVSQYLVELGQRLVLFGVPIASLAIGFRLYNSSRPEGGTQVARVNDIGEWIRDQWFMRAAAVAGILMMFFYLHLELNRTLGFMWDPGRLPVLTLLWLALIGLVVYEYTVRPAAMLLWLSVLLTCGLVGKLVLFDIPSWGLRTQQAASLVFDPETGYSALESGLRMLDFGAIVVFLMLAIGWLRPHRDDGSAREASIVFGIAATGLLFVFLTLETNTLLFHFFPRARVGGISILWTLFALGLVLTGILKQHKALRYTGLVLFTIVVFKVFLVDLKTLDAMYKIVAFIVLGILVMAASAIYLKYRELFEIKPATEIDGADPDGTAVLDPRPSDPQPDMNDTAASATENSATENSATGNTDAGNTDRADGDVEGSGAADDVADNESSDPEDAS